MLNRMPTFEFENEMGAVIERIFPMGKAPDVIEVNGIPFRRIISQVAMVIPARMSASGDDNARIAQQEFERPNPAFGGKSAKDLVKEGKATTKACSRWT